MSNRITILDMCVPCNVLMSVRQFSLDLDLILWFSEQGYVLVVKSISHRVSAGGRHFRNLRKKNNCGD